jgi:orotate phosphoribosyltransferase
LPILRSEGNPSIEGLVISVDRMERGKGAKTATEEVAEEFGISTFSIVTVKELLPEIPEEQRVKMEAYMDQYCVV